MSTVDLAQPFVALDQADEGHRSHQTEALRATVVPGEAWDRLALGFQDVSHEQTQCFNSARYAEDQIQRLAFWRGAELVAAALLRTMKIPGTGVRLTVSRSGPMWRPAGKPASLATLTEVSQCLVNRYATRTGDFLLLLPRCDPDYNDEARQAIVAQAGVAQTMVPKNWRSLPNPTCKPRYFVDVSLDPNDLRASFAQKWRYNLKKSEKKDLQVEILEGDIALQRFQAMHQAMVQRKGFRESGPIDVLADMLRAPQPALRPLVFIISSRGEDVAGAVVDVSGVQANYLYGATRDTALPLKAGYFMQWKIIEHICAMPQLHWYGLGGGTSPTCSLHQFKRGLVGKAGIIADEPDALYRAGSTYAALVGSAVTRLRWFQVNAASAIHQKMSSLRHG